VLRGIFGPKRDELSGEWRRLHNQEFYGLYSPPNTIRAVNIAHIGERYIQSVGGET
jgi:hypothetical protein